MKSVRNTVTSKSLHVATVYIISLTYEYSVGFCDSLDK